MSATPPSEKNDPLFVPLLDDYARWFNDVLRQVFYTSGEDKDGPAPPESFALWLKEAKKAGPLSESARRLKAVQDDLVKQAHKMAARAAKRNEAPPFEDFDSLMRLYEDFVSEAGRVERQRIAGAAGLDPLTGLKDREKLDADLKLEMERLERKGMPFCLTLVRIDDFSAIVQAGAGQEGAVLKETAGMIRKSLRSFDDAYTLGDGHFVLSLKQTDISGGMQALKRLRYEMGARKLTYKADGKTSPLSLSACIAAPSAGDNTGDLIEYLHDDLRRLEGEGDTVLEYTEISPLERYVRKKGGE